LVEKPQSQRKACRSENIYEPQLILGPASIKTTEIYLNHLTPAEQAASKGADTKTGTTAGGF